MKKLLFPVLAVMLIVASSFTIFLSQEWKIGDKAFVKFDGGDPAGQFTGVKGSINFDPSDLAASKFVDSIDVSTINTGNGMKNTHAKSEKWFDVEKFPTIIFASSAITKTSAGYEAKGMLTMHGVQKEVVIPFTFDNNVFKGSLMVNRLDYNINTAEPNHGASNLKVDIEVPVTK
ncbi:MAG TPA: YceI family protein [Puia sp.]|jgi:polyisoprenoid-binding protein YceI|nr:YceI family protein [Puia sp.]